MCHFAMISNSDSFESTMRMYTYTTRGISWRKFHFSTVIQQEKRAHTFYVKVTRKEIMYPESIANPMWGRRRYDLLD
jgi:hypothetical protein